MRIGFDVRPALRETTGVGRYLIGLLPALMGQGAEITALSSSRKDRFPAGRLSGARLVDRRIPVRLLDQLWLHLGWPKFETLAGPVDLVHSPTPFPLPSRSAASVVTLHDLFFVRQPEAVAASIRNEWVDRVGAALKQVDAIICVSEHTAREARELLDAPAERLHVVHHGLDPVPAAPDVNEIRSELDRLNLPPRFLLAVGTLEIRKNYLRLLEAFQALRETTSEEIALVIAGPDGTDGARVRELHQKLGLGDAVRFAGYLGDHELNLLYHAAEALVMPSLDEGFGFPVLEALARGTPVIASSTGALREVAGEAALYVDPLDGEALVEAMRQLLVDPKLGARLREAGPNRAHAFTWEAAARKTIDVYRQVQDAS